MSKAPKQPVDGLRVRRKLATRKAIASVAARLFKKGGYESVRMIDIAKAADVSEQTLYNYFPTKEHLIFDLDQEFEAKMIGLVVNRRPGITIGEALQVGALEFLKDASRSVGKKQGLPPSVVFGPALRRVWVEMNARHADSLSAALILDSGGVMPRASGKILARLIVAVFAVILEELGEGAMAGKSRKVLVREIWPAVLAMISRVS